MLYTRKGDDGTTGLWGQGKRISKHSHVAEALGCLDELNSFLGICKVKTGGVHVVNENKKSSYLNILQTVQENLFIIQAELAGTDKHIHEEKIKNAEEMIDIIEQKLKPIKTFIISGGIELAALLDYARTLARRAERHVIALQSETPIHESTRAYLNRLSSLLFALARYANAEAHIKESPPTYT